jgi:uncharacterized membrane protein YuzA (DUF378 family)
MEAFEVIFKEVGILSIIGAVAGGFVGMASIQVICSYVQDHPVWTRIGLIVAGFGLGVLLHKSLGLGPL